MANFTETQIQTMIKQLRDEYSPDIATRELAILELEDMERKGCVLDFANRYDECYACPKADECPVCTWEKRHPEYANDELAMKIKVLEAGGEEAYEKKLEAQNAARMQKEEQDAQLKAAKENIDCAVIKIRNEIEPDSEKSWWKELDEAIEAYVNLRIKYDKH